MTAPRVKNQWKLEWTEGGKKKKFLGTRERVDFYAAQLSREHIRYSIKRVS